MVGMTVASHSGGKLGGDHAFSEQWQACVYNAPVPFEVTLELKNAALEIVLCTRVERRGVQPWNAPPKAAGHATDLETTMHESSLSAFDHVCESPSARRLRLNILQGAL